MRTLEKLFLVLSLLSFSAGCTLYHYPVNAPLSRYDPDYGYKPKNSTKSREAGDLLLLVTFSGGEPGPPPFPTACWKPCGIPGCPREGGSCDCWMRST